MSIDSDALATTRTGSGDRDLATARTPRPPSDADEPVLAGREDLVQAILGFDRWPRDADVSIVLSIREDYLARLLARTQAFETGIPIVRLPPLTPDGARAAIVAPLNEARLAIEPDLLDALLADFQRAAAAIGTEMGWGAAPAVFPPHLQLACSVLYEALGPDDVMLTLAHYKRLGGFDAIVGEHLDRVIETELDAGRDLIARDLFLALVTGGHERAIRPESELLAIVGAKHGREPVHGVLEVLRSRGLLVRVRGEDEPSWELVHDSLVPRVLAWIDRKDLARRRAIELIRYHLRRSTPDSPSLLGRRELRELRKHPGVVDELDKEWRNRTAGDALTPSRLVSRSRAAIRRRALLLASVLVAAFGIASFGLHRSYVEQARSREEASLRDRDLGRFTLSLEPFDWDPVAQKAIRRPVTELYLWELRSPERDHDDEAGAAFDSTWIVHDVPHVIAGAQREDVEAHGGAAFLIVQRSGCSAISLPLRRIPGYALRAHERPIFHVRVPTCAASQADMLEVPAGPFIYGGLGNPPSTTYQQYPHLARQHTVDLPAFWIDRTEVTNAAFAELTAMSSFTGISGPTYPRTPELRGAEQPRRPVTGIDWLTARAYCQFLGKVLPSSEQWLKALRGGERLPDRTTNPEPRRNFPWGISMERRQVNIRLEESARGVSRDVGTSADDVSPYGVLDLAGGVTEWTASPDENSPGMRIARGGNFIETVGLLDLADSDAIENTRPERRPDFLLGFRCADQ